MEWKDQARLDPRDYAELFATAIAEEALDEDEYQEATHAFRTLLWRSDRELLEQAIALTGSGDPRERGLGVDLLGQIHDPEHRSVDPEADGWTAWSAFEQGFVDETIEVLTDLAGTETDDDVLDSIAWAFGHRWDPRGLEPLLHLAQHESEEVRFGATRALPSCAELVEEDADLEEAEIERIAAHNDQIVDALIERTDDDGGDVRDWALFGLALLEADTPAVRDAFVAHLADEHEDAREEAICGLARLGDERGTGPLIELLLDSDGEGSPAAFAAAEQSGDPRLLPALQELRAQGCDTPGLLEAIAAYEPDGT